MDIKTNIRVRYDHFSNCHNYISNRFNLKRMNLLINKAKQQIIDTKLQLQRGEEQIKRAKALLAKSNLHTVKIPML